MMKTTQVISRIISAICAIIALFILLMGWIALSNGSQFRSMKTTASIRYMDDIKEGRESRMPSDEEMLAESVHGDVRAFGLLVASATISIIGVGALIASRFREDERPNYQPERSANVDLMARRQGETFDDWAKRVRAAGG